MPAVTASNKTVKENEEKTVEVKKVAKSTAAKRVIVKPSLSKWQQFVRYDTPTSSSIRCLSRGGKKAVLSSEGICSAIHFFEKVVDVSQMLIDDESLSKKTFVGSGSFQPQLFLVYRKGATETLLDPVVMKEVATELQTAKAESEVEN